MSMKQHLRELIEEAGAPTNRVASYDQPPGDCVEQAEEEFEAAGFDVEAVPWGAIAMRGNELREES
jgi:hypothetical protein